MKGQYIITVKIGERLKNKLQEIKEQEEKRGRDKTSWREAGEILSKRIDLAGGLKQLI